MGINFNSVGGVYQKTAKGTGVKAEVVSTKDGKSVISSPDQKNENADKVSISAVAAEKYEVYRMTKSVMSQIEQTDNTERIAALKESIGNNTYQVPVEAIADKIISRFSEEY